MVFGCRDNNLVSFSDKSFSEREGNQVNGSSGSRSKNNLFAGRSIQILPYKVPGILIGVGRFSCKKMYGTVNIGIGRSGKFDQLLRNGLRPLGSSCIVQVHQRFPVYRNIQYRELCTYIFHRHKLTCISLQIYIILQYDRLY